MNRVARFLPQAILVGVVSLAAVLPARAQSTGFVDQPINNASASQPFVISGWAANTNVPTGTGVDTIHVWACPGTCTGSNGQFWGAANYGFPRPDVASALGNARFTNSGYVLVVSARAPATYTVIVYARTAGVTPDEWTPTVLTLTVLASPHMNVEQPAHGATVGPNFTVSGWALDAAWTGGVGPGVDSVTIYAYPNPGSGAPVQLWGTATLGGDRGDVKAALGLPGTFRYSGFTKSLTNIAAGTYHVIVYAHSQVTGNYQPQTLTVYVSPPTDVTLTIDRPGAGTGAVTGGPTCGGGAGTALTPCIKTDQPRNGQVTLMATADATNTFVGWGGACQGVAANQACTITTAADTLVIARFDPVPPLETSYYHLDALGSVRVLTNESGVEIARHDYFPFGEDNAPPSPDPRRFTGKEHDTETELDYFGARYYRNLWARFVSVDPTTPVEDAQADPQRWNRYSYVMNRPLNLTDPDGRCPACILLFQRVSELAQRVAASPAVQRAQQVVASQATRAWVALTQFFNSAAGQEAVQTVAELATGAQAPSAASTFGFSRVEGAFEGFTVGRLANGAEVAARFSSAENTVTAAVLGAFNAADSKGGTLNSILEGAMAVAKKEGASQLRLQAVGVVNEQLAGILLKRGFKKTSVTIGNETVSAFEKIYDVR